MWVNLIVKLIVKIKLKSSRSVRFKIVCTRNLEIQIIFPGYTIGYIVGSKNKF